MKTHVLQRFPARAAQRGAALLVSLILLIVITLVGLAAVGTTILQNQMAANQFDRQVAFQSAEAAVRAATAVLSSDPTVIARNCQLGGVTCLANPFTDPNLPANSIRTVAAGTAAGTFSPGNLAASAPQYVVESLGNYTNYKTSTGFGQTANSHQYGVQGDETKAVYYRITARSGDPSKVGARAVVTLQVVVRQG